MWQDDFPKQEPEAAKRVWGGPMGPVVAAIRDVVVDVLTAALSPKYGPETWAERDPVRRAFLIHYWGPHGHPVKVELRVMGVSVLDPAAMGHGWGETIAGAFAKALASLPGRHRNV